MNPPGGLLNYFRENVVGGPGAFALEVRDFARFGEAMTRKLVLEIAGRTPDGPRFSWERSRLGQVVLGARNAVD